MTNGGRYNAWIQTYTGKKFYPFKPNPDDICLEDIAHALSMKCRFGGHTQEFYSVAQHSVLCSTYCESDPLWGLLHDAAEAYMPDVATPVKVWMHMIVEMERRLIEAIAGKFDLPLPIPSSVKAVDTELLVTEKRDLMGESPERWPGVQGVRTKGHIWPWSQRFAESEFIRKFEEITGENPSAANESETTRCPKQ